jgi:hypothetical protein
MKQRHRLIGNRIDGFSFGVLVIVTSLAREGEILSNGFTPTADWLDMVDD